MINSVIRVKQRTKQCDFYFQNSFAFVRIRGLVGAGMVVRILYVSLEKGCIIIVPYILL